MTLIDAIDLMAGLNMKRKHHVTEKYVKVTRYVINNESSHTKTEKKFHMMCMPCCMLYDKKWALYDEKNVSHKESYIT